MWLSSTMATCAKSCGRHERCRSLKLSCLAQTGREAWRSIANEMTTYSFATSQHGTEAEKLGDVELSDDAAALVFAQRVVFDLLFENSMDRTGWSLGVSAGTRNVGGIFYKPIPS